MGKNINVIVGTTLCLSLFAAGCDDDDGKGGGGVQVPTATRTNTVPPAATATRTNTVPPGSTATPTQSAGVATPTATQGSTSGPSLEDVEAVVSGILPSIVSLSSFGSLAGGSAAGSGGQIGGFPVPCPSGGTLTFTCGASGGGSQTSITFSQCRVSGEGTPAVLIDGTFAQTTSSACFTPQPLGAPINIDFAGRVETSHQGAPIAVMFDMGVTVTARTGGVVGLLADGTVSAPCVGSVNIDTLEEIVVPADRGCPIGGRLRADLAGGPSEIVHTTAGGVEIDLGANGSVESELNECTDANAEDCE